MNISPSITECEEYGILSSLISNSENTGSALEQLKNRANLSLKDNLENHLQKTWNSILHLSSQQSHSSAQQESLVKLLQALITQPVSLRDINGKEVEVDGGRVWQDLPLFGQQARECWNFPDDKEVDTKTRDIWINVNAFIARLTAAAINAHGGERPHYGALDFSLYGVWSLRSALEEELSNLGGKTTIDATVGAAAVWILYAGPALKGLSASNKTFSGKVARPGFKFKEKEWRGYNQERWEVWTKEFLEVENLVQDDKIKDIAAKAIEAIKQ